jgi:hypothetical protein
MVNQWKYALSWRSKSKRGDDRLCKKRGYLQKILRHPNQYKLKVEVDVRIKHTL